MPRGSKMTIPCIGSFQQQQARILSEHKVGQPASVVSEFGSPLNGKNPLFAEFPQPKLCVEQQPMPRELGTCPMRTFWSAV
jgi:hypothetical protein